jgi:endonuclease III related protein
VEPAALHVRRYYRTLLKAWGVQDWWPARSRFEVIVGAFLTQNTAWANVERALGQLRRAGKLSVAGVRELPEGELARLVRSSGYFRQKAKRLKNFVACLDKSYGGSLRRMLAQPTGRLREELLGLNGVGPETADSILLYAGGHPVFVVDTYTRRVLERHGVISGEAKYEEIRALVEGAVRGEAAPKAGRSPEAERPKFEVAEAATSAKVFNEYHALFVQLGKRHCLKAEAKCAGCPLEAYLPARKGRKTGAWAAR